MCTELVFRFQALLSASASNHPCRSKPVGLDHEQTNGDNAGPGKWSPGDRYCVLLLAENLALRLKEEPASRRVLHTLGF